MAQKSFNRRGACGSFRASIDMSCRGEWINFEELCRRVPTKSARTLRRYIKGRVISYRQTKVGGRLEFNWRTVERELQTMETHGSRAHVAAQMAAAEVPEDTPEAIVFIERCMQAVFAAVGVPAGMVETLKHRSLTGEEERALREARRGLAGINFQQP